MSNKIKQCSVCGKEIAKSAKICPICGAKIKKPIYKRWWFIVLAVLIVLSALLGGGEVEPSTDTPTKAETKKPEIEYTAYTVDELIKDLEKNAASAKDKYDGQYVELTGRLSYVDSDSRYFGIKPLETGLWLESVTCYIKGKEQKENIKKHEVEEKIVIKGKITDVGEILGYDIKVDSIE